MVETRRTNANAHPGRAVAPAHRRTPQEIADDKAQKAAEKKSKADAQQQGIQRVAAYENKMAAKAQKVDSDRVTRPTRKTAPPLQRTYAMLNVLEEAPKTKAKAGQSTRRTAQGGDTDVELGSDLTEVESSSNEDPPPIPKRKGKTLPVARKMKETTEREERSKSVEEDDSQASVLDDTEEETYTKKQKPKKEVTKTRNAVDEARRQASQAQSRGTVIGKGSKGKNTLSARDAHVDSGEDETPTVTKFVHSVLFLSYNERSLRRCLAHPQCDDFILPHHQS